MFNCTKTPSIRESDVLNTYKLVVAREGFLIIAQRCVLVGCVRGLYVRMSMCTCAYMRARAYRG